MKIGVVGGGFVGLVTAACLAERGHQVHLIEQNAERLDSIAKGRAPFFEPDLDVLLGQQLQIGRLTAGEEITELSDCQVAFLAVGTPTEDGAIDLSQVLAAVSAAVPVLRNATSPPVLVVKSTVVPGTTEGDVAETARAASAEIGRDLLIAMNPEFLREGAAVADFRDPDRIVIGTRDPRASALLREVYQGFDCPLIETSPVNAELIKYAGNALLATMVSYSNDLAGLCEGLPGADMARVTEGLFLDRRLSTGDGATRVPAGITRYLTPGLGFGGSCLPKDVAAIARLADSRGTAMPVLEAVLETNRTRPLAVLALAKQQLGALEGRRVALLGLAFKPGTDDTRASVAVPIATALQNEGAEVVAYDPFVTALPEMPGLALASTLADAVAGADLAIIVTAWPDFAEADWADLATAMRRAAVIDGRGLLRGQPLPECLTYLPIGLGPAA